MLQKLIKLYEGDAISRITSGLILVPIEYDGILKEVHVDVPEIGFGTAIFTGRLNGTVLWTGGDRISIESGQSLGSKTAQNIAVEVRDKFHLDLVQMPTGLLLAPIVVTLIVDDGIELEPEVVADEAARFALTDKIKGDIIRQTDTEETYVVIDVDELDNEDGYLLIAEPGGSGGGDLLAANNLSDLDDSNVAIANLGAVSSALGVHAADDTYSGFTIPGLNNSGGVTQWEAVYLNGSSAWVIADANGSGTYPARGLAVSTETNGNPVDVLTFGTVRNDAWAWTPGDPIYLSGTAGELTQTAPATSGDNVQIVGYAITADNAFFDFNPTFITLV